MFLTHGWEVGALGDDCWALPSFQIACRYGLFRWFVKMTCRVCTLQRFLSLNATDCTAIARIKLASIELTIVFSDTWRATGNSLTYSLNIQVGSTRSHRIATSTLTVKVDVNFGNRAPTTILTFIIETFSFSLAEGLLLLILEV